ncbi:MAG: EAL domain-containing protein, partial [Pseudomonadota bacterium]
MANLAQDGGARGLEALREENRILREAIQHFPIHFGLYDRDGRLIIYNEAFSEAFPKVFSARADDAKAGRLTYRDVMRESVETQVPADQVEAELNRRAEANRALTGATTFMTINPAKGHMRIHRFRLPSGAVGAMAVDMNAVVAQSDALKEARATAEALERRLREAMDGLPFSLGLYAPDGRVVMLNQQFREASGLPAHELAPGQPYEELVRALVRTGFYRTGCDPEATVRDRVERLFASGGRYESRVADGRVFAAYDTRTESGDIVSCRVDITELKRIQARLEEQARALKDASAENERQALHDSLTGLANRRRLDLTLAEIVEEARESGERVALLHVDLDRFKQINDTLGHAAGDHVLRRVATILRQGVDGRDLASRVGGDEFVLVLRNVTREDAVMDLARWIVEQLREPFDFEGVACRIGGSVGVAFAEGAAVDAQQLLINADVAMYRAKELGKNRAVAFTRALQAEVVRVKTLADEILLGLDRGEFFAVYQPQYHASDLSVRGLEALCRWRHPRRGVLAPTEFLSVAEDLQVVDRIDRAVFEAAMRDVRALQAHGHVVPRIAFNVSAKRLLEPGLIDQVRQMRGLGVEVAVELLESISFDEVTEELRFALDGLREMSVGVEIDDFGSARASVVGLMAVMPDAMKLDQQIVRPAVSSRRSRQLLEAMLQIGRALDIEVVAEGVET